MLSFVAVKTIDDTELKDRLKSALTRSFERIAPMAVEQIKDRIKSILTEKLAAWVPEDGALDNFPFLKTSTGFVESYLHCVRVETEGFFIGVIVDSDEAVRRGLPSEIGDLLEYGSSEFPQLAHIREAMDLWVANEGRQLMEEMGKAPLQI